jgi:hypothetical protein
MNPFAFLILIVITAEYINLSREQDPFNMCFLFAVPNIILAWLCLEKRIGNACELSSILAILLISCLLVYNTYEIKSRLRLLFKIIVVFILLTINKNV